MPTQEYRGHIIDVVCQPLDGFTGSRTTIRVRATGVVRHRDDAVDAFRDRHAAQDNAFSTARAWIEASPLHWPFPRRGTDS